MAEFNEVIRQAFRLCDAHDCDKCPIVGEVGAVCLIGEMEADAPEKIERIVMQWAKENQEPKYPSWKDAWKQLFPDMAEENPPCYRYFISSDKLEEFCPGMRCNACRNLPIRADVAKKLGVKPIKGGSAQCGSDGKLFG